MSATPPLRFALPAAAVTAAQVGVFIALWLLADLLTRRFALPLPANLLGLGALFALLLSGAVRLDWVRRGANWLLTEMLLFFIPAVVAVVKYPELMLSTGWRILLVVVLGTLLVMVATALVVDRIYRFELWLARRRRRTVAVPPPGASHV